MTLTQPETAENEWKEIRSLIDAALESLSEEDRGIVISRHLQQMSLKDAGTVLGISEDAVSPAAISVMLPETNEMTRLEAAGMAGDSSPGRAAPPTTDESEWIALWKKHAPPQGSFTNLMAAISRIEDPLKRGVFGAVAYSEWIDQGLPIPGDLDFGHQAPLFEQMLAKNPLRAGEMAASFNTDPKNPRYLEIFSKLVSLVSQNPEGGKNPLRKRRSGDRQRPAHLHSRDQSLRG